jgi:hypothetical protein
LSRTTNHDLLSQIPKTLHVRLVYSSLWVDIQLALPKVDGLVL